MSLLLSSPQVVMSPNVDASTINAPVLDWSTTPLADDYAGHYVKIIDNVFSDEECASLIALAESDSEWKQAAVHYGLGPNDNYVNTEYRNSERILRFDHDAAEKLYKKLLPYIPELVEVRKGNEWEEIFGKKGMVRGTWTLVGYVFIGYLSMKILTVTNNYVSRLGLMSA